MYTYLARRWSALERSRLSVIAAVAVAYGLLAMSAYELFGALSIGVTFFPPAGLTFACFLLLPRRMWPSIAGGIIAGEVTVNMIQGQDLWWSLGWAAANLVEPFVGAWVARRIAPSLTLNRQFALAFLVGGLLIGPACGAAIGATVLAVADQFAWFDPFPDIWVGDALGVLVIAPLVIVLARPADFVRNRTSTIDVLAVAVVTVAVSLGFVIADTLPLGYAAIALLAVPAARYSAREVAVAGVGVATVLTAATARGRGPWASVTGEGAQAELVQQQAFLLVALLSAWLLKLEVAERLKANTAAQAAETELAAALERARDQKNLRAMHEALSELASAASTDEVLDAIPRHSRSVLECTATIVLLGGTNGPLRIATVNGAWQPHVDPGDPIEPTSTHPLAVAATTGSVVGEVCQPAVGTTAHQIAAPLGLTSKRGALGLARPASNPWSERDQIRALAFAGIVADALNRIDRYEADHGVALTLQHAIMPGHVTALDGTSIAARYLPATESLEVGGDWYDVIIDEQRRTATIVIGDVVGHSLAAAAAMGNLASASRALAYAGHAPADLVDCLDVIAANTANAPMTSMACARLDLQTGSLRYSLAGHPPPLLRGPDGAVIRLDEALSTPLAVSRQGPRPEGCVNVPPGTSVLFYTDGLIEQRRSSLDERIAQLETAFVDADPRDPGAVCDALVRSMLATAPHEDDVALVCLTLLP